MDISLMPATLPRKISHARPDATSAGSVTLVGAGPGDPDLLTLKAVKAIASATVLLVDDLVNDAVLAHAGPSARVIHVGKRGGCASTPQAFIEKLMVQQALAGETVVRLKGGDPFIFGRGGEEVEHLRAAGVTVQVVNGITSGLAAVTALNVPLTHRDHAHGVVLVTGHAKPGDAGTDWAALAHCAAQARLTLVIYMGVTSAERIEHGLLQGLPAATPVAIVQHASLPQQRHASGTLGTLCQTFDTHGLGSPSIIVVGDVLKGLAHASMEEPHDSAMPTDAASEPNMAAADWSLAA
jgi:uroporphyrin-III C-methyltransferase